MIPCKLRAGPSVAASLLALLLLIGSRPEFERLESELLEGPVTRLDGKRQRASHALKVAVETSGEPVWGYGELIVEAEQEPGDTADPELVVAPTRIEYRLRDGCGRESEGTFLAEDVTYETSIPFSMESAEDVGQACAANQSFCLFEQGHCELDVVFDLSLEEGLEARLSWRARAVIEVEGNGPFFGAFPDEVTPMLSLD
jgi:hypothetical protein